MGMQSVVWGHYKNASLQTDSDIFAARFTVGVGWSAHKRISNGSLHADQPDVAISESGDIVAVWRQHDGTRENIWSARYQPSVGWSTPETIESLDSGSATTPQIAINSLGEAMATWAQSDGSTFHTYINRYIPDMGWENAPSSRIRQQFGCSFTLNRHRLPWSHHCFLAQGNQLNVKFVNERF